MYVFGATVLQWKNTAKLFVGRGRRFGRVGNRGVLDRSFSIGWSVVTLVFRMVVDSMGKWLLFFQ